MKNYDFMAPVRAWPGLNRYVPRLASALRADKPKLGRPENLMRGAQRQRGSQDNAGGWGNGTLPMNGTPTGKAPGWMK